MSNALYAFLALALVTSVGAGVAIHAMDTESAEPLGTGEGMVTALEWNPHFNVSVELTLTAANGTNYSVELAPPWWWAEQHFPTIHVNDTLKVEGRLDDGHEIEAFTVWINGGEPSDLPAGAVASWGRAAVVPTRPGPRGPNPVRPCGCRTLPVRQLQFERLMSP